MPRSRTNLHGDHVELNVIVEILNRYVQDFNRKYVMEAKATVREEDGRYLLEVRVGEGFFDDGVENFPSHVSEA